MSLLSCPAGPSLAFLPDCVCILRLFALLCFLRFLRRVFRLPRLPVRNSPGADFSGFFGFFRVFRSLRRSRQFAPDGALPFRPVSTRPRPKKILLGGRFIAPLSGASGVPFASSQPCPVRLGVPAVSPQSRSALLGVPAVSSQPCPVRFKFPPFPAERKNCRKKDRLPDPKREPKAEKARKKTS